MSRAEQSRFVCLREELADGGLGVPFAIQRAGRELAAIAIAFRGRVYAYANQCPHRGTTLDWQPGRVFDETGLYLVCATHGALFLPDSGLCVAGPCCGASLQSIPVRVAAGGRVELIADHRVLPRDIESA
jgi:nitrite reductase/ring-hydroxylating ferredoxin subunit